ncbi:hypothetical protein COCON_G00226430 [Conger conger]|uniref:Disrupted in schizophrenia 1 protein n=1 Tax=Conger conger TaxID=82655 RepID=A0A9Q1CX21_CONCO|nr:hypothetical protein COCON_G00226430 [Conger conger]
MLMGVSGRVKDSSVSSERAGGQGRRKGFTQTHRGALCRAESGPRNMIWPTGGSGAAPAVVPGVVGGVFGGVVSRRKSGRRPGYLREQEEGRTPPVNPALCAETANHSAPLDPGPAPPPPLPHPPSPPCPWGVSSVTGLPPSLTGSAVPPPQPPDPLPHSSLGPHPAPPPARPAPALPERAVAAVTERPLDAAAGRWPSRGDPAVTPDPKDVHSDSDSDSASSLTSGYESASAPPLPCGEAWDALRRRYEAVLQECLHSSRRNAQIEAMMMKLQRLQQKAVLEDDYDTAERFGQKLEELGQERGSLQLGLPSRHPAVSHFLERLRRGVGAALQDTEGSRSSGARSESVVEERERRRGAPQDSQKRREQLVQEQQRVQEETQDLRSRLQELQERSQRLEAELQQEEEEPEEGVAPALRSSTPAQLQELSRALEDLVTSQHRAQICTQPPALLLRLQEQEAALKACIKETTAKVVMSQRVGGGLRRRVSVSEAQLLALQEAKLAAISGTCRKALQAELKVLHGERERLEGLASRLQALSSGTSRELARMKSQHCLLRQDLQQRQAQYESTQRENTLKYIELLEDKLHSCGNSVLERVWEADLEAPPPEPRPEPRPKQEQDCAMLTALGGRWCSETGLQHSEFTKKLEEFLFCMEDSQDPCDLAAEVTEVMERCELIGRRLETLEEQLQTAILDRDPALAHILILLTWSRAARLRSVTVAIRSQAQGRSRAGFRVSRTHSRGLRQSGC